MAVVKGSKQVKMVVVPHRPRRYVLFWFSTVILTVVVGSGTYFYGYNAGMNENLNVRQERDQLRIQMESNQEQLQSLEQQVVNIEQASAVDRQSILELQNMLVDLREVNAQLEEDVLFYRQIMSPENTENGLVIGQLDLTGTEEENRVRYRIELKQLINNENVVSGHVNVNVVGIQNGQEVSMPLREMAVNEDRLDIRLQFRYFQNIEGELIVPENFEPESVQIVAESEGQNAKIVRKSFVWLVER
tara:strand:+ start:5535 stop:6272 length:738 start_codon:yes stop_codon:yes gene_type:complete